MFKRGKGKDIKPQVMESSSNSSNSKNNAQASKEVATLIGAATNIVGDIRFTGILRIYGSITGDLVGDGSDAELILESQGSIKGEIRVSSLYINGSVEGNVYVNDKVRLFPGARIQGDVHYNLLEMEVGAEVNGRLLKEDMVSPGLPEPEPPVIDAEEVVDNS